MKIRSDILRTYQSIHTWTGIIAGLVLFIGFYAGSLSMFKPQIEEWATPPTQQLSQVRSEQLDNLLAQALKSDEKVSEGFIINLASNKSPMMWYEQGGGRGIRLDDSVKHASLSDTGELITQTNSTNELGNLIDQLHRTAGIVGKVDHEDLGVLILGIAALLYFLALVSGVIFLLPTMAKSLFALRKNKGSNRFWLDSHNLVGVLSLPFHIIIAWTVVVFAFHDIFYGGLSLIYGDKPLFEPRPKSDIEYSISELPSIESYITQANKLAEGYSISSMEFTKLTSTSPSVTLEVIAEDRMMRGGYSDYIYMNPYTYDVQYNTISADNEGAYGPIVTSLFALHFGNYAGTFGRWIYFIMGLLGAFLFYSGNLLWLEKRRQKKGKQTRGSRFMASLTIGVCLGSLLGVGLGVLTTKWLYLITQTVNSHYLAIYYLVFSLSIAYSFLRGAALSAIHLLYLLAVTCLLIPGTSLLTFLLPELALWTPQTLSAVILEVMALIFGCLFGYGATKTKRRAYLGDKNSIWSLRETRSGDQISNEDHSALDELNRRGKQLAE